MEDLFVLVVGQNFKEITKMKDYLGIDIQVDDYLAYGYRNGDSGAIKVLKVLEVGDDYIVAINPRDKSQRKNRYRMTAYQAIIIDHIHKEKEQK